MVSIPTHIRFWGLDSGIKHSVGGADYGSVRIGTFIGRKIIKSTASASFSSSPVNMTSPQNADELNCHKYEKHGMELLKAEASLDYLCNLSTHRYEGVYGKKLPGSILGESFLEQYITHEDSVTVIDPRQIYAVKAPTKHPVYENFRVEAFKVLLTAEKTDDQYSALGELMYQCHYSYSDCGLGSDGTDRLVDLVQQMQYHRSCHGNQNLFGAKITGGGSGGTVCIIGRNCSQSNEDILEIQERYKASTGYLPFLFDGSSPGAGKFGYLKLRRRPLENKNPDE